MYGLYGLKHYIVEISGDVTDAGRTDVRTDEQGKIVVLLSLWTLDTGGLVPQHMIEESFRSSADGAVIASRFLRASSGRLVIGKIGRDQKNVEISSQD